MRVLWFVNVPFSAVIKHYGLDQVVRGGWMQAMADELRKNTNIELGIVWSWQSGLSDVEKFTEDGNHYYVFPSRYAYKKGNPNAYTYEISKCKKIINEFNPDVIEIYGTENFYGLLGNQIDIPIIINIQGIVNEIKKYYWGEMPLLQLLKYPREIKNYLRFCKSCHLEIVIFKRNNIYCGRTFWDESIVRSMNRDISYYEIHRILRPPFYETKWDINKVRRHSIYCTSGLRTYKGLDILVKSIKIIKNTYPDITLRIAGKIKINSGLGKYIKRLITKLGLTDSVIFLGMLSAEKVADELSRAHIYVLPAFIENSPNSAAEALLVGTPTVAAHTGGVPSLIEENKTGLLFSRGDYAVLAQEVIQILKDDTLAVRLSHQARKTAMARHDTNELAKKCVAMYREVIDKK